MLVNEIIYEKVQDEYEPSRDDLPVFAVYNEEGKLIKNGISKNQILFIESNPEKFKKYGKLSYELSPALGELSKKQVGVAYDKKAPDHDMFYLFKQQAGF
jgi:hypothetical protein